MAETLPLILALNNVRSLHNTGAIFRTADALNLEELILGGLTPVPPRFEIEKTALGATKTVKFTYTPNLVETLIAKQVSGYKIYAIELTEEATDLFSFQLEFPCVMVLGHERAGVEPPILELADQVLKLPMRGTSVYSLNVSNTAAVVGYEAMRQAQKLQII